MSNPFDVKTNVTFLDQIARALARSDMESNVWDQMTVFSHSVYRRLASAAIAEVQRDHVIQPRLFTGPEGHGDRTWLDGV